MKSRPKKIAILHHTGGGNLGDDAIMDVVVANIRHRWPDAELTAISMNPEDTTRRHGIPARSIRRHTWGIGYGAAAAAATEVAPRRGLRHWLATTAHPLIRRPRALLQEFEFLLSCWRCLLPFDLLIVSGGGQLTERSGPWGFPYGIFVWVSMARLARVRRIFLNVGAGPLKHPLSHFFVVRSLYAANYVSFRDEPSQALARSIGFHGRSEVLPDNVYSLEIAPPQLNPIALDRPLVGLAPMPYPYCDPREHAGENMEAVYQEYLGKFALFASSLVRYSCSLELFGSDAGADSSAIQDLRTILRNRYQIATPPSEAADSVDELLSRMAAMDYVVTCRFHGVVLAHILNKPVLAIAHHPKVTHLMEALGLSQYCFDIATFDPLRLTDAFVKMVSQSREIKAGMNATLASYRSRLALQYDQLFPPVSRAGRVPLAPPSPSEAALAGRPRP